MRQRRWQLSAEYRAKTRRLGARGIGSGAQRGWKMDGHERRYHLSIRYLPAAPFVVCELYANRKYAVHACPLLAWRRCRDLGAEDQGKLRALSQEPAN